MIFGWKSCKIGVSQSIAIFKTQRRCFRFPYENSSEIQRTPRYLSRKYNGAMWLAIEHICGKEKNIIESLIDEQKLNIVLRRITRRSKRKATPSSAIGKQINSFTGSNRPPGEGAAETSEEHSTAPAEIPK